MSQSQIRHEVHIHDVDVEPVGTLDRGDFVCKAGEVGGQDRRRK